MPTANAALLLLISPLLRKMMHGIHQDFDRNIDMSIDMNQRELDVIVWGATGFTGQLVVAYLAQAYGVDGALRWAIAGRNREKLDAVRKACLPDALREKLPIIQADSNDAASLARLAQQTRVLCTTVGPYAKYGTPLVAACVEAGTHYCDLTGEVQWMARVIPQYQAAAEASGARIVHTCGFDSVPFDMGNWYLQQQMFERHGVYARREIRRRFRAVDLALYHGSDQHARRASQQRTAGFPLGRGFPLRRSHAQPLTL